MLAHANRLPSERKSAESPAHSPWRDWLGEYRLAPQFSLRVFESQGRLMVQGTGQPAIAAEVVGADRAAITAVGAQLLFRRNSEGQVMGLVLNQNGQQLRGSKQ